jgi:hypothetical protein
MEPSWLPRYCLAFATIFPMRRSGRLAACLCGRWTVPLLSLSRRSKSRWSLKFRDVSRCARGRQAMRRQAMAHRGGWGRPRLCRSVAGDSSQGADPDQHAGHEGKPHLAHRASLLIPHGVPPYLMAKNKGAATHPQCAAFIMPSGGGHWYRSESVFSGSAGESVRGHVASPAVWLRRCFRNAASSEEIGLASLALGQGLGISDIGRIAVEIIQDVLDGAT